MSACVSSLIPSAIRQSGRLAALAVRSPQGLLEALGAVADPRKKRGVRHGFISILALCACAVLAGARSFIAIAEWAMDLTPLVRAKLGVGRVPPCEATIRRVLQRVDPTSWTRPCRRGWRTVPRLGRDGRCSPWTVRPPVAPAAQAVGRCTCSPLLTRSAASFWDSAR